MRCVVALNKSDGVGVENVSLVNVPLLVADGERGGGGTAVIAPRYLPRRLWSKPQENTTERRAFFFHA